MFLNDNNIVITPNENHMLENYTLNIFLHDHDTIKTSNKINIAFLRSSLSRI